MEYTIIVILMIVLQRFKMLSIKLLRPLDLTTIIKSIACVDLDK